MNIGERIQELITLSGFDKIQVLKYLEIDQSYLDKIESGECTVSTDVLCKFADLLYCDFSMILDGKGNIGELKSSFSKNRLTAEDLKSIAMINRIALNLNEMEELATEL